MTVITMDDRTIHRDYHGYTIRYEQGRYVAYPPEGDYVIASPRLSEVMQYIERDGPRPAA